MTHRDMRDWQITMWYHAPSRQQSHSPAAEDVPVLDLHWQGSREAANALGEGLVAFLRSAGLTLELTEGHFDREFRVRLGDVDQW